MADNEVINFYNQYAYPILNNITIEELVNSGYRDVSDPCANWDLFWPNKEKNKKINVLVAGCGTIQAALIAARNPNAFVTGIDVSKNSLNLQKKYSQNLTNINLCEKSILNFDTSEKFDLIVCTGVLHHLEDPVKNINHLSKFIKDDGIFTIMVYNKNARYGVNKLKQVIKLLNLEPNRNGIEKLEAIIRVLHDGHSSKEYIKNHSELQFINNAFDTFFNPYEKALSILDIEKILKEIDLHFYDWLGMNFLELNETMDHLNFFEKSYCLDLLNEKNSKITFMLTKEENLKKIKSEKI